MARVRFEEPVREQGVMRFEMPEDALPPEHSARVLWHLLGRLDLSAFAKHAKAVDGHADRPVLSPRMLLTLWLYAISVGRLRHPGPAAVAAPREPAEGGLRSGLQWSGSCPGL